MIRQAEIDSAVDAHQVWGQGNGQKGTRLRYVGKVFEKVSFSGVSLESAIFEDCRFNDVDFRNSEMSFTVLSNCVFFEAQFSPATLIRANFSKSTFLSADFKDANLAESNFDQADISGIQNAVFDQVRSKAIIRSPNTGEAWTQISTRYTGPRLAIFTLFFFLFLLPYIVKAIALSTAAEMEIVASSRLPTPSGELLPREDVLLFWVLLGSADSHYLLGKYLVWFNSFVAAFHVVRAALTLAVSFLAHNEHKYGRSPRLKPASYRLGNILASYNYLRILNILVQYSGWIVLIGATMSLSQWLVTTISVPQ